MRTRFLLLLCGVLLVIGVACAPRQAEPEYRTSTTIKDIMEHIVDPSADYIWQSVSTEETLKGTIERAPKTDADWAEERSRALILMEASNLLQMPGRQVAPKGDKSEHPGIEESPEAIQDLIDHDRASWIKYAHGLYDSAEVLYKAAQAKDAAAIENAGEELDRACENCHKNYWYPHQYDYLKKTGGSMKPVVIGTKEGPKKESKETK